MSAVFAILYVSLHACISLTLRDRQRYLVTTHSEVRHMAVMRF